MMTGRRDHPVTREAGKGTPGDAQGTGAEDMAMVTLAATALEGKVTPSDTPDQQHGSPPLPSGGGFCLTLRGRIKVDRQPQTLPW